MSPLLAHNSVAINLPENAAARCRAKSAKVLHTCFLLFLARNSVCLIGFAAKRNYNDPSGNLRVIFTYSGCGILPGSPQADTGTKNYRKILKTSYVFN